MGVPRVTDRRTTALALASVALFLSALGLRVLSLDYSSLWQDEVTQIGCTTRPISSIWQCSPDNKPPLDYYIQSLFVGDDPSDFRVRIHAAIIGSLLVVVMAWWGWLVGGFRLAAIVAGLCVSLPLLVRVSQEGRPYSLMLLAEALFFVAFWRLALAPSSAEDKTRRSLWVALAASVILCLWSHYLLALPVGLSFLFAAAWGWKTGGLKRFAGSVKNAAFAKTLAGCVIAIVASALPLALKSMRVLSEEHAAPFDGWATELSDHYLDVFAQGYYPAQVTLGAGWVLIALMAIGWIGSLHTKRAALANYCLALFLAIYFGTFWIYSLLDHWVVIRYVLPALLPALMLAAMGIDAIARGAGALASKSEATITKLANGAAVILVCAILAIQIRYVVAKPVLRPAWREVIEEMSVRATPNATVVIPDYHSIGVATYYMKKRGMPNPVRGIYYDDQRLRVMKQSGRDLWVFATYKNWKTTEAFMREYLTMPEDDAGAWGIEVRRNVDAKVSPLEMNMLESANTDFRLEPSWLHQQEYGDPAYLGKGWLRSKPWAHEIFQRALMSSEAEIIMPSSPAKIKIWLVARLEDGPGGDIRGIELFVGNLSLGTQPVTTKWSQLAWIVSVDPTLSEISHVTFRPDFQPKLPAKHMLPDAENRSFLAVERIELD